jgi:hypothetical protein
MKKIVMIVFIFESSKFYSATMTFLLTKVKELFLYWFGLVPFLFWVFKIEKKYLSGLYYFVVGMRIQNHLFSLPATGKCHTSVPDLSILHCISLLNLSVGTKLMN